MAGGQDAVRFTARQELETLHHGLVVDLDRRINRPARSSETAVPAMQDVGGEVASTIAIIQQTADTLTALQDTIQRHEETLYEQRQVIAELQNQKSSAFQELANAERAIKGERERADRAERDAQANQGQIRQLEEHVDALRAHLKGLMGAVHQTLAVHDTALKAG